ncbi:hypothetical protein [Enhygromyxa salina]|uniref:Uncharacterized protein n=1 Tax=Enhygromyxa salina TaxID=215803 RepID=A0A2S9YU04_9BACT|nr:hypothetical protein [Enhygromyxa salina]PRQ08564.1 hypothetical protein ENSA7_18500 [Enhygromyxa salina]
MLTSPFPASILLLATALAMSPAAPEPDPPGDRDAQGMMCAVSVVATASTCFAVSPICPLAALAATCTCVPLFEPQLNECS